MLGAQLLLLTAHIFLAAVRSGPLNPETRYLTGYADESLSIQKAPAIGILLIF